MVRAGGGVMAAFGDDTIRADASGSGEVVMT